MNDGYWRELDRNVIKKLLPSTTPIGLSVEPYHDDFLKSASIGPSMPTLHLEALVMKDGLQHERQLKRNEFYDQEHLVSALAHVDLFVTDDIRLTKLISRLARTANLKLATAMTGREFGEQHLGLLPMPPTGTGV